jgi:RNA-directed DNA polymerase
MLDPKPERTPDLRRPTRILSRASLYRTWKESRDSTSHPGRPGIDGVTAQQFGARLDFNLRLTSLGLRDGTYGPSRLKPILIPKPNTDKERLICIPTVRDRLVQRTIMNYLVVNEKFPIYNSSSHGFIEGRGTQSAISEAKALRGTFDWCLKTDIEAFFDRIPRQYLKRRARAALGNHSLIPLISKIIDCEIKDDHGLKPRLRKQGIIPGTGIRQGMPLSPILSNLALSEFDHRIERAGIRMIRYADDILLFFSSKKDTIEGHDFIKSELKRLELGIPKLGEQSKTWIVPPREPVYFLGREIAYIESENRFVSKVGRKQIQKLKDRLTDDFNYDTRRKEGSDFQETMVDLWTSISAYLGIYKDAYDFIILDSELRGAKRRIIGGILTDIFGESAVDRISGDARDFLGIGALDFPEPNNDLEL